MKHDSFVPSQAVICPAALSAMALHLDRSMNEIKPYNFDTFQLPALSSGAVSASTWMMDRPVDVLGGSGVEWLSTYMHVH